MKMSRRSLVATWVCRVCFTFVFVVNVHCALSYVLFPRDFMGGFQLSGIEGVVAIQGIGIAFLMWNATYPAFIALPRRFTVLGCVILAQQVIGLVGESAIYLSLPAGNTELAHSILSFITFDSIGLVLMVVSFTALRLCVAHDRRVADRSN